MAKPRQTKHDEVLLIPFLDILCSLIGVLILIIVVLCLAQTQRVRGRSKEDIRLAQRHQMLTASQKTEARATAELQRKLATLNPLVKSLAEKRQKLAELRRRLAESTAAARDNTQKSVALQKQIERLIDQIETLVKAIPPLQTEIASLTKQLADRKQKADAKPAVRVVRSSGSGGRQGSRVFFVEASGGGIVIHKEKGQTVRVTRESVGVDKEYNTFLSTVKGTANAALIFLVRRDGWWAYQMAAGWAEQGYGLSTSKLPIPGDGPMDLSLFGQD